MTKKKSKEKPKKKIKRVEYIYLDRPESRANFEEGLKFLARDFRNRYEELKKIAEKKKKGRK